MRSGQYVGKVVIVLLAAVWCMATWGDVTTPWDVKALSKAPRTWLAPEFSETGVTGVFYEGLPYQGKPTRVFAWYGVPERGTPGKVPAMVLVHGGGGTAFAEWVRLWTSRGYAAIAMDTCGCVPRGKYGAWQRHDAGGPAGWGGFDRIADPIADQWTYHAVADVLLAHSLIRSFAEVDPSRTGITGISWGGYLTCIAAGVDGRFKCAIPVYGCGFLGEDSAWLGEFEGLGKERAARWLSLWDPSVYLPHAAMPMLWVTGTNDFAYPMDSLRKSYQLPTGGRTLCVRIRMPHGHGGAGENPEEIRAFADSILLCGERLARVTGCGHEGSRVWVSFAAGSAVTKAELVCTKDKGKWQDRAWTSSPAELDVAKGRAEALLPEGTTVWYINLIDGEGRVVSSPHEEL